MLGFVVVAGGILGSLLEKVAKLSIGCGHLVVVYSEKGGDSRGSICC